jgi:hypothetical protein
MTDELMLAVIPKDFGVELLGHVPGKALFGAKRKDVWHFVHWQSAEGRNSISQAHVPRFAMAKAVSQLRRMAELRSLENSIQGALWVELWHEIGICEWAGTNFAISWLPTDDGFPARFSTSIASDLPMLARAEEVVRLEDGLYVFPGFSTHRGNPLAWPSPQLVEAVAFEQETRQVLDAHEFAIYSVFCTLRDFPSATEIPLDTVRGVLEIQFEHFTPDTIPDDVLESVMKVQEMLLSEPVWGLKVESDLEHAVPILAEGMSKLSPEQRAQFTLLSGMYNAGVLVVLATILGCMTFERYAVLKCEVFQPDSEEEQSLRTHLAFIELLGKLGV